MRGRASWSALALALALGTPRATSASDGFFLQGALGACSYGVCSAATSEFDTKWIATTEASPGYEFDISSTIAVKVSLVGQMFVPFGSESASAVGPKAPAFGFGARTGLSILGFDAGEYSLRWIPSVGIHFLPSDRGNESAFHKRLLFAPAAGLGMRVGECRWGVIPQVEARYLPRGDVGNPVAIVWGAAVEWRL